jgi:hypothetical protein
MIRSYLLAFLLLLGPVGTASGKDGVDWKLVSDRDGIQIYMAHSDDSRIKTFRGVTTFELNDFYSLAALLDDEEYYPRWLYLIRDLHEVRRRSATDRDYYVLTKLPWPVVDRDAGLNFVVKQDAQTHELQISFRAKSGIAKDDNQYVRIPEMYGYFNALPVGGKRVQVTFEVRLDPGGYIPAFLANFILKDIPFVSLQRVRRIINTERFAGYVVDYIKPPEPWAP